MRSPFPGMDPWLEDPEIFPDLHNSFITYSREALQAALPEPYYAATGRRTWLEVGRRVVEPDLNLLHPPQRQTPAPQPRDSSDGSVAVAPARQTRVVLVEPFLEIYVGRGEEKRLVVTLEVLSPTNKAPGAHGREQYLRKQQEIISSPVHLIEIDLLRAGTHATAVPHDRLLEEARPFDYHVCVHRFDNLGAYYVYPVRLQEPLPEIEAPLLPGDGPVKLDLQAVFSQCYDTGPYPREIDYRRHKPTPPLTSEQAEWAKQLLAGHLPAAQ